VSEKDSLLLLGAGPIGLAAAAEASAGANPFRCIAPSIDAPWLPNYALWQSDAARLDLTAALRLAFDTVDLVGLSGSTRTIPLGYGFLNNATLQRRLRASSDGRWQQGRVEALTEAPDGGYRITPYDPDFERQMAFAEEIMHEDRDILRALAK
jgi:hypothetical protein